MSTFWHCIGSLPHTPPCGAKGSYVHTAKTGASGPAWKHTETTGHATIAAAREWVCHVDKEMVIREVPETRSESVDNAQHCGTNLAGVGSG